MLEGQGHTSKRGRRAQ